MDFFAFYIVKLCRVDDSMCGLFVDEISTIVWLKECDFHDYDVI